MTKAYERWNVLPHGKLSEIDDGILTVIGQILAGFAGEAAQIPKVVKMALIKDSNALRAQLLEWAELQSLKRILVSHGEPIEANPRQTLRDLAASLA
jgi:hypothetical protein